MSALDKLNWLKGYRSRRRAEAEEYAPVTPIGEPWVVWGKRKGFRKDTEVLHYGDSMSASMKAAWLPGWSLEGSSQGARRATVADVKRLT